LFENVTWSAPQPGPTLGSTSNAENPIELVVTLVTVMLSPAVTETALRLVPEQVESWT
jgi:hypothetical protein